jgi:serine/threonine protein kinase
MALLCQPGAELITGYQLVQKLGMGGYGEVWKATAPGGLAKAIKIVYGHMRDARAEQELKSLGRIREVRHPFILSLERFEVLEDQLVIVMELADRSLIDRFRECQQAGLPGIPRKELLGYLRDAAEALDYMGEHYGLQHLDIKPQNLLLVGGRVKLADFGLVKDLENSSASATGGITAIYATPEAFDGRVSRYSDQYSLAIVYQEMLTGCRPFPGTTPLQLATQHSKCPPMLGPLPLEDRPTIARALSKVPDQRFPTCSEMVQRLLKAGEAETGMERGERQPVSARPAPLNPPPSSPAARMAHTPPPKRAVVPQPVVPEAPNPDAGEDGSATEATIVYAQPSPSPVQHAPAEADTATWTERPPSSIVAGSSLLRPTLFIGVGGIAGWTLKGLRQRLHHGVENQAALPFRLLLLDTDRAGLQQVERGEKGEALQGTETLFLPLMRPEHYRPRSQTLLRWLDRRWLYNIPRSLLTEGARPLGRLAFVDHAAEVLDRLREAITALLPRPATGVGDAAEGASPHAESIQVFLIASLCGGTGSGIVLSLAYAVQQVLAEFQLKGDNLCAILVHATSQKRSEQELARLNAFATLVELQHFTRFEAVYPGDPEHGLNSFGPETSPVRDLYIVHLGDQLDQASAEAATDSVADYLYLSAATGMGAALDRWRQNTQVAAYGEASRSQVRIFGLHRLSFPRFSVGTRVTDWFCKDLLERWRGQAGWDGDRTDKEVLTQISLLGFDAENLANQFRAAALRIFGESPEQTFTKMMADFALDHASVSSDPSSLEFISQALTKIGAFLGFGANEQGEHRVITPVDRELNSQAKALSEQLGRSLKDWLLTLVEDPERRLKAAHHAARRLVHHLSQEHANLRQQLTQLRRHRSLLRRRYSAGNFGAKSTGGGWLGSLRGQRAGGSSPKQKLIAYCCLLLHESVLENIVEVFHAVAGRITSLEQELQRAGELMRDFGASLVPAGGPVRAVSERAPSPCKNLTELFPGQCRNVDEAARYLFERLKPKLIPLIETNLQTELLDPRGGLWKLVSGTGEPSQRIQDEIKRRALTAVLDALGDLNAAKLLVESPQDPDHALRDLLARIGSVAPHKQVPRGWQHLLLALPNGPEGSLLRQLLGPFLAEMPNTMLDSDGDIVLCHEAACLPLNQLAEILLGDEAVSTDAACHVLTRQDIAWAPLAIGNKSKPKVVVP